MTPEEMIQYGIAPSDATSVYQIPVYRNAPSVQYYSNPDPYTQAYSEDVPVSGLDETNAWRTLAGSQPLRSNPEILQEQFDRATNPGGELAKDFNVNGLGGLALRYSDLALPAAGFAKHFLVKAGREGTTALSRLAGLHPWEANADIRDMMLDPTKSWLDRQAIAMHLPPEQSRVARSIKLMENDPTREYVKLPNFNKKSATNANIFNTYNDKMIAEADPNYVPNIPAVNYRNFDDPISQRMLVKAQENFTSPVTDLLNVKGTDQWIGTEGTVSDGFHRTQAATEAGIPLRVDPTQQFTKDGIDYLKYPTGFEIPAEQGVSIMRTAAPSPRTYIKKTLKDMSSKDVAKYKKYLGDLPQGDLPDLINSKSKNILEKRTDFFSKDKFGFNYDLDDAIMKELNLRNKENIMLADPLEWASKHSKNPVTKWVAKTQMSPEYTNELKILEAEGYLPGSKATDIKALNIILDKQVKARGGMKLPPLNVPDYLMLSPAQLPSGIQRLSGFLNP